MDFKGMVVGGVALVGLAVSTVARADGEPVGDQAEVSQSDIAPASSAPPLNPVDSAELPRWERARFSGGRMVVEILVGAALGSLSAYLVYDAAGGGIGGALGGLTASVVVEPLAVWGVGSLMGGQGKLSSTYLGGLMGFTVAAPATQASPALVIAIGEIFMPIGAAAMFELTSNVKAKNWMIAHGAHVSFGRVPLGNGHVVTQASLAFRL